jgi:hypothetical protein
MGFRPPTPIWPARSSSLPARRFGMAEAASTFWLTRARRASPPAVKAFLTTNADISRRPAGPSPRTRGREGSRHSLAQAAQAAPRARAIAQPISAQRPIPIGSKGMTHQAGGRRGRSLILGEADVVGVGTDCAAQRTHGCDATWRRWFLSRRRRGSLIVRRSALIVAQELRGALLAI